MSLVSPALGSIRDSVESGSCEMPSRKGLCSPGVSSLCLDRSRRVRSLARPLWRSGLIVKLRSPNRPSLGVSGELALAARGLARVGRGQKADHRTGILDEPPHHAGALGRGLRRPEVLGGLLAWPVNAAVVFACPPARHFAQWSRAGPAVWSAAVRARVVAPSRMAARRRLSFVSGCPCAL